MSRCLRYRWSFLIVLVTFLALNGSSQQPPAEIPFRALHGEENS
jgi:hypothetical protein